jgi:superfamily II DNA/RNA helicase
VGFATHKGGTFRPHPDTIQLMTFADLGLSEELLQAVEAAGYTEPTPIQAQAIPQVQMMRDIIAIAGRARPPVLCCR